MESYDLVVIGGGPGGYVAALRASQLNMRTALVEEGALGGVCLNVGCIPTKALLRSAEVYETFTHADRYGVTVDGTVQPDWTSMQKRKAGITERLTGGIGILLKKAGIDVYNGRGVFIDRSSIRIESSGASLPPGPDRGSCRCRDSTTPMSLIRRRRWNSQCSRNRC